ncbi:hydroxymethylglutaryl-coenzyme A reductase family protein [Myriangium duriaei CBS 260.36]|uniref:hydroxymethylglutaryl-CoA reductase (NADPH) n=1 Tax=Myriangium duriaei CBS 260.36 TaxID=1168546 RepID=A0A9P4IWH7_9PEZI|nr:hydroxymethylglutaryl-coenzyme A reductase family protein [Myriangium duriaei CBS 260.36]
MDPVQIEHSNNSVVPTAMTRPLDGTLRDRATATAAPKRLDAMDRLRLEERCPVIVGKAPPQPLEQVKIENAFGFSQVPIGLAGPLTISGKHQDGSFHAPLATVEATLVASCSRGCKAFQASGGIKAAAFREGMIRAPVFRFNTVSDAVEFATAVPQHEPFFRTVAEKTTRFGKLQTMKASIIHNEVHVRFSYTCGDAGGQNMTTIATHTACHAFLKKYAKRYRIIDFVLEGQMASDKKLALINVHDPRGVSVIAWGTISDSTCRKVLGCSTTRLHQFIVSARNGSIRAGMLGDTANASNVVAAMFIACGQDAASVFEGGWAQFITSVDEETKEMTLSMYMPSLPVGSIGGGTGYSTQREALGLLGCWGEGKKWAFAESVAAFALALDVSTAAAMSNDTFSRSHERLARL